MPLVFFQFDINEINDDISHIIFIFLRLKYSPDLA